MAQKVDNYLRVFPIELDRFALIQKELKELSVKGIQSLSAFEEIVFKWCNSYQKKPFAFLNTFFNSSTIIALKDFLSVVLPLAIEQILTTTKETFEQVVLLEKGSTKCSLSRQNLLCLLSHLVFATFEHREEAFEFPRFQSPSSLPKKVRYAKQKIRRDF